MSRYKYIRLIDWLGKLLGGGGGSEEGLVLPSFQDGWQHRNLSEFEGSFQTCQSSLRGGGSRRPVGEGLPKGVMPLRCTATWCHVTCKSTGGLDTGSAIPRSQIAGIMLPAGHAGSTLHSGHWGLREAQGNLAV